MKNRIAFLLIATPIVWLVIVAPLTTLLSWWIPSINTFKAIAWSLLLAPVVSFTLFTSLQTSSQVVKWPLTQLIGWTTVLLNVVVACSVLLLLLPTPTVALIASVLWLIIGSYAVWKALNIQDTKLTIQSDKLSKTYRVMHLSDIHAGSRSSAFVKKVVTQAMLSQPDIILITGDLLDSSAVDEKYLISFKNISCPVFVSLGNHERYVDLQKAIDAISANETRVLRDEATDIEELRIIAIDDADNKTQVDTVLPTINRNPDKFQILMYHKPEGFEFAASNNIDLMLSGHTHAGQMWPFGLLVKRQFPFVRGSYHIDGSTLFVSEGTGTWGPIMRLGTKSEMTLITLAPASG